jgi:hypothetical protein
MNDIEGDDHFLSKHSAVTVAFNDDNKSSTPGVRLETENEPPKYMGCWQAALTACHSRHA